MIAKNHEPILAPIIKDIEINEKIESFSDDPIRLKVIIDNINEGKRMKLLRLGNFRDAGYVIYKVTLVDPIHVKKSFIKYDWLKKNGFIGPDDILILENDDQYGLYRNIRDFLNYNKDFIKAFKNKGSAMIYKFSKYGVEGQIEKRRDDTENKRLISEINNIMYSIGGDKFID